LRFEVTGRPRSIGEQMYKMGLLPLAIPVIKNATNIEYRKARATISRKKKDGKMLVKDIEYWGLTDHVGKQNVKVKVVLRRIGNGKIIFWSIIKKQKDRV